MSNHLKNETSPYLLQHVNNPVDWYPWGAEALEKAVREDKPILVSIGYSACHWCHVMAHETFENTEVAALMNQWFVNIKIDREERPDLDAIYMDAVQALNGNGGWPLNVFLTPDKKPFYGGTYFPPNSAYGRMGWVDLLKTIHDAYAQKKETVAQQSSNLLDYMHNANAVGNPRSNVGLISREHLQFTRDELLKISDTEWGGFSRAPKFPQSFAILYLLRQTHYFNDEAARQQALLSLDRMMQGGIYDHVGGGFARYSTDKEWQVPHFEKMLYDNALLLSAYSEAFALTQDVRYAQVIISIVVFLQREMMSSAGGFYAALDADSEGVEGKYYTWSKEELLELLGRDADLYCEVFDVWKDGNWEKTNILWQPERLEKIALKHQMSLAELQQMLQRSSAILLEARSQRPHPGIDDKIILGWNALAIIGLCDASASLQDETFLHLAEQNIHFLENTLCRTGYWLHSWKPATSEIGAFLDDYAYLIRAYIRLQELTGNLEYFQKAVALTTHVIAHFSSLSTLFFYTAKEQTDVILRKKEIYDNAVPSGNAMMAHNLFYLGTALDRKDWKDRAEKMLLSVGGGMVHYPTSFGYWTLLLQQMVTGFKELAVIGKDFKAFMSQINALYIPEKMLFGAEKAQSDVPLLSDKDVPAGDTNIFLCENYSCQNPVKTVDAFKKILH